MRITLLVVGKTLKNWVKDGLNVYEDRLSHYTSFRVQEIPELKNVSALTREQIKRKEGELILKNLQPSDRVILLDERGRQQSSMEWGAELGRLQNLGRNLVYVVGGAYGFSDAVYERADDRISLSRLTFSHQMVRVIFAEQLYRAFTILNGEPYHHE